MHKKPSSILFSLALHGICYTSTSPGKRELPFPLGAEPKLDWTVSSFLAEKHSTPKYHICP